MACCEENLVAACSASELQTLKASLSKIADKF
jgi:hypothetical protein